MRVLTRQISCKFQFPWNFSFSLAWGWLWTLIFPQKFHEFYRNSNLFSYMDFCTECMTVRKNWHLGHINHEKKLFKYNLNITLVKTVILLNMLFFEKKPCNWPLIPQSGLPERGSSNNILTWKFLRSHQSDIHIHGRIVLVR